MHTLRKVSDTQWTVGYYRPPIPGDPHNVWLTVVAFNSPRLAAAAVSALNGGGTFESFTEQMWLDLEKGLASAAVAKPA